MGSFRSWLLGNMSSGLKGTKPNFLSLWTCFKHLNLHSIHDIHFFLFIFQSGPSHEPGSGGAPGTACIFPSALATPGGMFGIPAETH